MIGVDLLGQMERDGYAVLRGTYPPELIARLYDAYMAMALQSLDVVGLLVGDRRTMFPIPIQPPFSDPALLATNKVLVMLRALLGPQLLIASYGGVVALPGAEAQHIHKDHEFLFPLPLGGMLPCHAVTLVVPLIDLDEETGTTAVFPGTHRLPGSEDLAPVSLWAKRGDCYMMDYRLTHAGTPNVSNLRRPLLYIVYSRPWFIDIANYKLLPPLKLLPEEQRLLPDEVRDLFRRAAVPLPK